MDYNVESYDEMIMRANMNATLKTLIKIKRGVTLLTLLSGVYILTQTDALEKIKSLVTVKGE